MPRREFLLQLVDKPWREVAASPAIERHLIKTAAPFDMFVDFGFDDDGNLDDELDEDLVPMLPDELDDDGDDDEGLPDPFRHGRR